jgi:hypothetical protein
MNKNSTKSNVFLTFIAAFLGATLAIFITKLITPSDCDMCPSLKEISEISPNGGDSLTEEESESGELPATIANENTAKNTVEEGIIGNGVK